MGWVKRLEEVIGMAMLAKYVDSFCELIERLSNLSAIFSCFCHTHGNDVVTRTAWLIMRIFLLLLGVQQKRQSD